MGSKKYSLADYKFDIEIGIAVTRYRLGVGFGYTVEDADNPVRRRMYEADFSKIFGFTLGHIFGEENSYLQIEEPSDDHSEVPADIQNEDRSDALLGINTESVLKFNGSSTFTKWLLSQKSPDHMTGQEHPPKWRIESVKYLDTAVKSLVNSLSGKGNSVISLEGKTLEHLEAAAILHALRKDRDVIRASRSLGIGKSTLYRRLRDYKARDLTEFDEFQVDGRRP